MKTEELTGALHTVREALTYLNGSGKRDYLREHAIALIDQIIAAVPRGIPDDPIDNRDRNGGNLSVAKAATLLNTITAEKTDE